MYLFTTDAFENKFSKLNEFISFLKFNRVNLPYKFSYVSHDDCLIPEITLNENILMNFSPNSLTAGREFQFQEFLRERPNRELENLYKKISIPHELPVNSDAQMRKISALIKSLIFEGQFIFLESPENDLDQESIALFISILKDHISRHKQNVFIYSDDLNLWKPHVHQQVKREKDYRFSTQKIVNNASRELEKNQFYARIKNKNSLNQDLLFRLPKNKNKNKNKKSAA